VVIAGQPETDTVRAFTAGWNFFGPLADRPVLAGAPFLSPAWYFLNGLYMEVGALEEGCGYWIYCDSPHDVDLGAP